MPYTPVILTQQEDWDAVRAVLGVDDGTDSEDFSDARLKSSAFLAQAEQFVISEVERRASDGVPTVSQLLSGTAPATAKDPWWLKNAAIYYIDRFYQHGSTNAINTSITDRSQTIDRGGIGAQWVAAQAVAEKECMRALRRLTGWKRWRTL